MNIGENINIYCGDCLELMKEIPDGSVDLVLCDLPYGLTACPWDSIIPFSDLWEQWERVCKDNGIIVLFGAEPFSSTCRTSNIKRYRYDWIWKKPIASGFLSANRAPLRNYENIMVFYSSDIMNDTTKHFGKSKDYLISEKEKAEKAGYNMREVLGNYMGNHYFTRKTQFAFPKKEDYEKLQTTGFFQREYDEAKREYDEAKTVTYNPQMEKGKPYIAKAHTRRREDVYGSIQVSETISNGERYPRLILSFNNQDKDKGLHPTQKPVPLLEYLIKTYTNEGETVLDNCMGSGSTGVACLNLNRKFIGMEIEEKYFNIAKERLESMSED